MSFGDVQTGANQGIVYPFGLKLARVSCPHLNHAFETNLRTSLQELGISGVR